MALDEKNFTKFFDTLRAIDLFGTASPAPPWGTKAPTSAQLTTALHAGENLVPVAFRDHYVTPFEHSVGRVISLLAGDAMTIETLAGAVYQHADKSVAPDLHRFLAVISNFSRSSRAPRKGTGAASPRTEQKPPLAMFQHSGEAGPFTITAEQIKQLTGGTIGVV